MRKEAASAGDRENPCQHQGRMLETIPVHSLCSHMAVKKVFYTRMEDHLLRLSDDIASRIVETNVYLGSSRVRAKKVLALRYSAAELRR